MRPNLRERFMENVRKQKMTSNFKSPFNDIASYYKGRNMETSLKRTLGFRKIPWAGCFEFPPPYPPGLLYDYRETIASSQPGFPFTTMPLNAGPFCNGCGAKLVPLKKDKDTLTDVRHTLNVYHCSEEHFDKKQSFKDQNYNKRIQKIHCSEEHFDKNPFKDQNNNKRIQKSCNCAYQAVIEDEESAESLTQQDFKIYKNYKLNQPKEYISNATHIPDRCVHKTSICSNCGTIFDPLKTCGQELLVYIEQEDTKIDLKQTEDKLASTHTKKKSTIKSFFRTISPKLRRKSSEEFTVGNEENSKRTKYTDCIVTGENLFHLLGKSSDPSNDSSSTNGNSQGSACERLERYNERKTSDNWTCGAYKGSISKLRSISESDEIFDQTKDESGKGKKKKDYMKYFKIKSPDIQSKIKVAYECACEDKCSCEDIEIGCTCGDEKISEKNKNRNILKSLSGQSDTGIEFKIKNFFSKRHKKDVKPAKIELCSQAGSNWKKDMLLEADDIQLKTPMCSKSSLVSIAGPATKMDETLSQRRLKKSEFVRTKSILEVTRGKLERGRPLSRLDLDDYVPQGKFKNNETPRKNFMVSNTKQRIKTHKNHIYNTPSYTETPEPVQTQCYPIKRVKRKRVGIKQITSYIEETKPGEYIFYDRLGIGKTPYVKEVSEGEPIFYCYNLTESSEEFSSDSLDEFKMCSSKDIDTRDIELYDEIDSLNSEPPRKRSVHFDESCLICPLNRNIPEQMSKIKKNPIKRKTEPKTIERRTWDSSIKKPSSSTYEVEMCPHGSSFNIVSELKRDTTLPLRLNKNFMTKNVQKNLIKNNIPKQDCLIYHMSQNLNTNIDKQVEYLTRKHPENNHGEKVNLNTAINALDKLSLENTRYEGKDPQVYTCFCNSFPEEPESESEESSTLETECMREEKLENIFPDLETNLVKRDDVDVISLIAHVLGMKHPLVQPPGVVLKTDLEESSRDKIHEGPKDTEENAIAKINIQRLEKKVDRDIKALDTELEERKALVGTLKERILQEKGRLEAERNRLDTRNTELGRIDPVTGRVLPMESRDENVEGKSNPPKGN